MRYHTARMYNTETDLLDDVHRSRGDDVKALYDTLQTYSSDYPHGTYSLLTPWHLKGRYMPPKKGWRYYLLFVVRSPLYLAVLLVSAFSDDVRVWVSQLKKTTNRF